MMKEAFLDSCDRFDGDLFRRLIEKVKVRSMVEVEFVFKTGVEVMVILGLIHKNDGFKQEFYTFLFNI